MAGGSVVTLLAASPYVQAKRASVVRLRERSHRKRVRSEEMRVAGHRRVRWPSRSARRPVLGGVSL